MVNAGHAPKNAAAIYGPALVMRTWGFGYITDTWGDIPYFEALARRFDRMARCSPNVRQAAGRSTRTSSRRSTQATTALATRVVG